MILVDTNVLVYAYNVDAEQHCGNLVTDAHLAALAIECDAAVCTTDRDFAQFQGLRLINPLI